MTDARLQSLQGSHRALDYFIGVPPVAIPEIVCALYLALFRAIRNVPALVPQAGLKGRLSGRLGPIMAHFVGVGGICNFRPALVERVLERLPGRFAALPLATRHVPAFISEARMQRRPSGLLASLLTSLVAWGPVVGQAGL
jgi:hypothetical protein